MIDNKLSIATNKKANAREKLKNSKQQILIIRDHFSNASKYIVKSINLLSKNPLNINSFTYKAIEKYLKLFEELIYNLMISLSYLQKQKLPYLNNLDSEIVKSKKDPKPILLKSKHFKLIDEYEDEENIEHFKDPLDKKELIERIHHSSVDLKLSSRKYKKHVNQLSFDV